MEKTGEIMPLLASPCRPRLRNLIVNWLHPLGTDPKGRRRRTRTHRSKHQADVHCGGSREWTPSSSTPRPRNCVRLITALGTYETEGLSPGEREPLFVKLSNSTATTPTAVSMGGDWTLRNGSSTRSSKAVNLDLAKLKNRGDRRWYVNGHGQTFCRGRGSSSSSR